MNKNEKIAISFIVVDLTSKIFLPKKAFKQLFKSKPGWTLIFPSELVIIAIILLSLSVHHNESLARF